MYSQKFKELIGTYREKSVVERWVNENKYPVEVYLDQADLCMKRIINREVQFQTAIDNKQVYFVFTEKEPRQGIYSVLDTYNIPLKDYLQLFIDTVTTDAYSKYKTYIADQIASNFLEDFKPTLLIARGWEIETFTWQVKATYSGDSVRLEITAFHDGEIWKTYFLEDTLYNLCNHITWAFDE